MDNLTLSFSSISLPMMKIISLVLRSEGSALTSRFFRLFDFFRTIALCYENMLRKIEIANRIVSHHKMIFINGEEIEEKESIWVANEKITSFKGTSSVVKKLHFAYNEIKSFSLEVGAFPNLEVLEIHGNELVLFFSLKWPNLTMLSLQHNKLTSFLVERDMFPNLEALEIPCNELVLFSPLKWSFPNLTRLSLQHNKLTSFLVERDMFPNLEILDLACNKLVSFYAEDEAFPKLEELHLSHNKLTTFSSGERTFPNLTRLQLSSNYDLKVLDVVAPNLTYIGILRTRIRFLDEFLMKIAGYCLPNETQAHMHARGTKRLISETFPNSNPVGLEIIENLTR